MIWYAIGGGLFGVLLGTFWGVKSARKKIKNNLAEYMKEKEVAIKNGEAFNWEKEAEQLIKSKRLGTKTKE